MHFSGDLQSGRRRLRSPFGPILSGREPFGSVDSKEGYRSSTYNALGLSLSAALAKDCLNRVTHGLTPLTTDRLAEVSQMDRKM